MKDLISRQQAILAIERNAYRREDINETEHTIKWVLDIIKWLPSVEELKSEAWDTAYLEGYTAGQNAQPKYVALHESCTDCPLYDRKNYNCPRFNRVIPMAIRDAQTQVKALSLPSVQPDISEYSDRLWKLAYERGKRDVQPQRWIPVSEALPKDDEEVIVTCLDDSGDTPFSYTTVAWHYKGMWVCENERCPFVIAWMPLPPSYKGGQDET